MPEPLPRTEQKKRWYFLRETSGDPGFTVLSKVFYSFDAKYLYERSGKRTPRTTDWRTWYDSETSAVGTYFTRVGNTIEWMKKDLVKKEKLYSALGKRLNELIDAEHAPTEPTEAE